MRLHFFIMFFIILAILGTTLLLALTSLRLQVGRYQAFWGTQAKEPGELVYVALGDSAAQGIGASAPQNSYVGLFARALRETAHKKVRIINLSKSGARTGDVLAEQLPALKALGIVPDVVTLDIGVNDIFHAVPQDRIADSIASIMDQLPEGSLIAEVPHLNRSSKNDIGIYINKKLQSTTVDKKMVLAPLYAITEGTRWKLNTYAADLFHPSDIGYENWFGAFWEAYENNRHTAGVLK